MFRSTLVSVVASVLLLLGFNSMAQDKPVPAPAATAAATPGIQSQNIFEVKPDASNEPGYAGQTNGERGKVQPGNNAPVWRQVSEGKEGYSSLPKREAPILGACCRSSRPLRRPALFFSGAA